MKLADYFAGKRGAQSRLSAVTGIPAPMLSQWATETRPVPTVRCAVIEAATGDDVRRWDLRPKDWHLQWPELIGSKGAPRVPAKEKKAA